jgi:nucleotide-binding universal stress UspA family protein
LWNPSDEGDETALRWAELLARSLETRLEHAPAARRGASVAIDLVRKLDPSVLVTSVSLQARDGGGSRLEMPVETAALVTRVACPVLVSRTDLAPPTSRSLRTVLAGTDFGVESICALQAGRALAVRLQCERLLLAHVCDDAGAALPRSAWLRACEERAQREFARLHVQLGGVEPTLETLLLRGDVAGVLTALAQSTRADWLVLGGDLRSERADASPGALLMRVLRDAPCPVLRLAS